MSTLPRMLRSEAVSGTRFIAAFGARRSPGSRPVTAVTAKLTRSQLLPQRPLTHVLARLHPRLNRPSLDPLLVVRCEAHLEECVESLLGHLI